MNQPLYVEVLSLVECHSYNCHIVIYAACVDRVVSFRSLKTVQCHVICRLLEGCPRLGGFWFRKAILVLEGCSNLGGLSSVPYALPSRMSTGFSSLDDHCLTLSVFTPCCVRVSTFTNRIAAFEKSSRRFIF